MHLQERIDQWSGQRPDWQRDLLRRLTDGSLTERLLSFTARVAANVAAAVEREIVLGPVQAARHRERLADLGFDSDANLAEAIHAGELDNRLDELTVGLLPDVVKRLGLWNPGCVAPEDADLMLPAPAREGEAPDPKNLDQEGR